MVNLGSEVYMQADVYVTLPISVLNECHGFHSTFLQDHWTWFFFLRIGYLCCRPDTRHIFVDVGLGFYVEFTWSEALKYISAREEKLER